MVPRLIQICWMVMFIFHHLDEEIPFWTDLLQKFKIVQLRWELVPRLTWIILAFSIFGSKIPLFGKISPKNQNFLFKMKLGVLANSNTLNLLVKFSRPLLDQKHPFRTICFQKVKNICLKWKLLPWLIQLRWIF